MKPRRPYASLLGDLDHEAAGRLSRDFSALARYNAEVARGLMHRPEWVQRMAAVQRIRPPSRPVMTRDELIALASPPCHTCGEPIVRVEHSWHLLGGEWRLQPFVLVCRLRHRTLLTEDQSDGT
jgi:hypothetical protein